MSIYTIGEIVVWLLLAAILGFIIGWLLRGVLRPRYVTSDSRRSRPQKDNLQLIYGIGPVITDLLHSMNITTFRQIALFTKEDMERVGEALEIFPDRIERDHWISSADALHREFYGEAPKRD